MKSTRMVAQARIRIRRKFGFSGGSCSISITGRMRNVCRGVGGEEMLGSILGLEVGSG
jgi:hypothetical protein